MKCGIPTDKARSKGQNFGQIILKGDTVFCLTPTKNIKSKEAQHKCKLKTVSPCHLLVGGLKHSSTQEKTQEEKI